jgi:serine protease Do
MRRMLPRAGSAILATLLAATPLGGAALLPLRPATAAETPAGFADLSARLLPSVVNVASTQSSSSSDSGGSDGAGAGPSQDQPLEQGRDQQGFDPPRRHQADATTSSSASSSAAQSPLDKRFQDFAAGPPSDSQADQKGGVKLQSLGSGFIIDPSGLIVTNNHVIDGADSISVTLADGTSLPADLVGRDTQMDIALLRVHADHPLPAVAFSRAAPARIGDWVLAIGNPYGLGGTVTAGIVSARGRDIDDSSSDDFIQTDAPINRGNSGGPLFNMDGAVIGINTAIYSPSGGSVGIGFAIPAEEVAPVVEQLHRYGKPRRGWLGAQVQEVTPDIAQSLGLPQPGGAMVAFVQPNSPAAVADLRAGDVILTFDGHAVSGMHALPRLVAEIAVGAKASLTYWRDGKSETATVAISDAPTPPSTISAAATPPPKPSTLSIAGLGFSVTAITPAVRGKYSVPENHGVVIADVTAKGPAAQAGLSAGDVILQLGAAPVAHPQDVAGRIDALRRAHRGEILLLVQGSDETQWVTLPLSGGT